MSEFHIQDRDGNVIFSHECRNNNFRKTLEAAITQKASMKGADLSGGKILGGLIFIKMDFSGATFSNSDVSYSVFENSILSSTNFIDTDLTGSEFHKCNLNKAVLDRAVLHRTKIIECSLLNARLFKTKIDQLDLTRSNLKGATLKKVDINNANLRGANLEETSFTSINWPLLTLSSVPLSSASSFYCDYPVIVGSFKPQVHHAIKFEQQLGNVVIDNHRMDVNACFIESGESMAGLGLLDRNGKGMSIWMCFPKDFILNLIDIFSKVKPDQKVTFTTPFVNIESDQETIGFKGKNFSSQVCSISIPLASMEMINQELAQLLLRIR